MDHNALGLTWSTESISAFNYEASPKPVTLLLVSPGFTRDPDLWASFFM